VGVFSDQGLGIESGFFKGGKVLAMAHIAQGNTNVAQQPASLGSFQRGSTEQTAKSGGIEF
jgi:hypothetical protein